MTEEEEFEFRARMEAEEAEAAAPAPEAPKGLIRRGAEWVGRQLNRVPAAYRGAAESLRQAGPADAAGAIAQAAANPVAALASPVARQAAEAAGAGLVEPESAPTSEQLSANFGASTEKNIPQYANQNPYGGMALAHLPPHLQASQYQPTGYTSQAELAGNALDLALPTGLELLPVGMAAKALRTPVGEALAKPVRVGAEKIQKTVLRARAKDFDSGFDIANIEKHGLQGSPDEVLAKADAKIQEKAAELKRLISEGADEGFEVDIDRILNDVQANIGKKQGADLAANAGPIFDEFRRWADEQKRLGGPGREGLDLWNAQEFKQLMGRHGSWEKFNAARGVGNTLPDMHRSRAAQEVYLAVKDAIETAAPEGVKEVNKALSELIPVRNTAKYRKIVSDRNNPIRLSDYMSTLGAIANPGAGLAMAGAGRFTTSGFGAKTLYRLAQGLEGPRAAEVATQLKKSFGFDEEDLAALRRRNDPGVGPEGRARPNVAGTRRPFTEEIPGENLPPELRGQINWNEAPEGRNVPNIPGTRRALIDELPPEVEMVLEPRRGPAMPSNFPPPLREAPGIREAMDGPAPVRRPLEAPPEPEAPGLPPRRGQEVPSNFPPMSREPESFREPMANYGRRQLPPMEGPSAEFPGAYSSEPWTPSSLPPHLLEQLPPDIQAMMMARIRSLAAPEDLHLPPYLRGQ